MKLKTIINFIVLICVILTSFATAEQSEDMYGSLSGKVIDRSTKQPIPGANVIVKDSRLGAASDINGEFLIENLPAGHYIIEISSVGYKPRARTDVIVKSNQKNFLSVSMEADILSGEEVTVTAGYFIKDKDVVTSARNLNYEEIRRAVGAAEDVQRVIQALPGVASANDQTNEVVVRGGSPRENLTVMDGIEIPNTNHYGDQGSTGGPINMINTEFLSEIDFMTGGFPAKFGDKLSSVLALELREGNRKEIDGAFDLSMAGAGLVFEGPIDKGRGSYLVSARKSYLDLINDQIGLTSVPEYWDTQMKIAYDLNPKHKLLFNWIYGNDKIFIKEEGAYSRGADEVDYYGFQYGAGFTLKSLWNKTTFSSATLSQASSNWDIVVHDSDGILEYTNTSQELENCLKYDFTKRLGRSELGAGISVKQTIFDHDMWARPDTTIYYTFNPAGGDSIETIVYDAFIIMENIDSYKLGLYVQENYHITRDLTAKAGLRYDYFDFSEKGKLSPRLGLEWVFMPKNTFTASYGEFYQTPPYFFYTNGGDSRNQYIDYEHARHFVLGYERIFNEGFKGTIEVYHKEYDDFVFPEQWIYNTNDPAYRSYLMVNEGVGYSRGIEFFLH